MVDPLRIMARTAGFAFVPDGQHLALSQLQGDPPDRAALAADGNLFWRSHCPGLVLFAAGAADVVDHLRLYRHRDSRRGHYPPPLPPASPATARAGAAATGASNQLMHSHRSSQRATIAIVGGESLLGKEIHEL